MRISDWSSDVCSSDLVPRRIAEGPAMSEQAVAKSRRSEASAELRAPAGVDLVEWYFEKGWTDGLPVVPPTPEKMSAMIGALGGERSEEHTSELQSLMRISYAGFCLKKKNTNHTT